jgi:hypothetical protein
MLRLSSANNDQAVALYDWLQREGSGVDGDR